MGRVLATRLRCRHDDPGGEKQVPVTSAGGRARVTGTENRSAFAPLDAVLRDLTPQKVPGLSIAVVHRDEVVHEQAAGLAEIATNRSAGLDTIYLWFSMTKVVTATAAMQLVERGRLGLDDPVQEYLGEFPRPRAGWPQVTVRHLLSHSSGLGNPLPVRWVHPADEPTREPHEFARALLARHPKLKFPAGAKASYTNLGYIALGEVISAAAGQRYEDHVREQILTPLSMSRTDFVYRHDMAADAATGYQSRRSPMTPLFRLLLPHGITADKQGRFIAFHRFCVDGPAYGGLIGSVRDAARFMSAHVNGGRVGDVQILSAESVNEMQTIQATGRKIDVGLGWFRRHSDRRSDERYLEHLGGGGGFFNTIRIYPDRCTGVALMGNATAYDHQRIAAAATQQSPGVAYECD
jgi:CubicO group peptidase (beta-lactamase class C family)